MSDEVGDGEMSIVQPSHVRNAQEGEPLTIGTLQLTIKASGAETEGSFALAEVTIPPYFTDIWLHCHQQTTEAIYLMQGLLAVTLGEETMVVRQGSFVLVRPGQVHRFWNPTASPTTFLVFFTPAGAEEFFEALSEMGLAEGGQSPANLADVVALGKSYDYFFTELPSSSEPS